MTSSDLQIAMRKFAGGGSGQSVFGDSPDDMVLPESVDITAVDDHLQATLVFPLSCEDYDAVWPKLHWFATVVRACIQQKDPLGRTVAVKISRPKLSLTA